MDWYFAVLMIIIGVWMGYSGLTTSEFILFRVLRKRARLLWKDHADIFLGISGVIIALIGVIYFVSGI
jgi:hypothetical protein